MHFFNPVNGFQSGRTGSRWAFLEMIINFIRFARAAIFAVLNNIKRMLWCCFFRLPYQIIGQFSLHLLLLVLILREILGFRRGQLTFFNLHNFLQQDWTTGHLFFRLRSCFRSMWGFFIGRKQLRNGRSTTVLIVTASVRCHVGFFHKWGQFVRIKQ